MPEYSGIATTVQQPPPADNGQMMMQMAEMLSRMHFAKQAAAQQKVQTMQEGLKQGIYPDPKVFRKVLKQAGTPLASDEDMVALTKAAADAKAGKSATGEPSAEQPPTGTPGVTGVPPGPAGGVQAVAQGGSKEAQVADASQKMQQNMTKEQGRNIAVNQLFARAKARADSIYKNEQAKRDYETRITSLKEAALGGDVRAAAQLASVNEIPFNLTAIAWQNGSEGDKHQMMEAAYGHMTEAQKAELKTRNFEALLSQHYDPITAGSYASAIADGHDPSPEVKAKLGQPTMEQIGEQAKIMHELSDTYLLPAQDLTRLGEAAMRTGAPISSLVPPGTKTVMQAQVSNQTKQANAASAEAGAAVMGAKASMSRADSYAESVKQRAKDIAAKYKLATDNLTFKMAKEQNAEFMKAMNTVLAAKKAGVDVDQESVQKVLDGLAPFAKEQGIPAADLLNYYATGQVGGAPSVPGGDTGQSMLNQDLGGR